MMTFYIRPARRAAHRLRSPHEHTAAWPGIVTVGEIRSQGARISAIHPHPQQATPLRRIRITFKS